jgi:hypothetical protein
LGSSYARSSCFGDHEAVIRGLASLRRRRGLRR